MRYEGVRQRALEDRHPPESGWEQSLLVRRGIVAWMRAWPAMAEPPDARQSVHSPPAVLPESPISIARSLGEEITAVLVNMIWPRRSEGIGVDVLERKDLL